MPQTQLIFAEIKDPLLNPSVEEIDEERLVRHIRRLYRLFWARHRIGLLVSTIDLEKSGKAQYNARLLELRHALIPLGQCIDRVRRGQNGQWYYKLVPLCESTYFAERKYELGHLVK